MEGKKVSKRALAKALRHCGGIQTLAAKALGLSAPTVCRCVRRWPELREIIEQAAEDLVDEAEVSIRDLVRERNVAATIFVLKTLGKRRGYSQSYEVTGANGGPLQVADVASMTDEELASIAGRAATGGGGDGTSET